MTAKETIEEKLEKLGRAVGSDDSLTKNVMTRIDAESKSRPAEIDKLKSKLVIRRLIMSRFTKLAAAAVIIITAALTLITFDRLVTPAYAIEQTIEAFKNVRFLHIIRRAETGQIEDERWIEIGPDGIQARYRQDSPPNFFVVDNRENILI